MNKFRITVWFEYLVFSMINILSKKKNAKDLAK